MVVTKILANANCDGGRSEIVIKITMLVLDLVVRVSNIIYCEI